MALAAAAASAIAAGTAGGGAGSARSARSRAGARGGPAPVATISPDELTVGQRGYGLSVFAGREPERFEAEVVGVIRNLAPAPASSSPGSPATGSRRAGWWRG